MSDQTDEQYGSEDQEQPPQKRNFRRELEERAAQAEQKAAELERKLAISSAGLDLSNPQHKYFAETYNGEMSPEAVKAKAQELGFLSDGQRAADAPKEDTSSWSRMDEASQGAQPSALTGENEAAVAKLQDPSNFSSLEEYAKFAAQHGMAKNLLNG